MYLDSLKALINLNKEGDGEDKIKELLHKYTNNSIDVVQDEVCVKKIPFCVDYITNRECKECEEGYQLSISKDCFKIPSKPIDNCFIYESQDSCLICFVGFHRKKVNEKSSCVINTLIENCNKYDPSSFDTRCLECEPEFFLLDELCELRFNPFIANCLSLKKDGDICENCISDFVLTEDSKLCHKAEKNCAVYKNELVNEKLVCAECEYGYYLVENECVKGEVLFCLQYTIENKTPRCILCDNDFYLKDDFCEARQVLIHNCEKYKADKEGECESCTSNTLKLNLTRACLESTIDHCIEFNEPDSCSLCEEGYIWKAENKVCEKQNERRLSGEENGISNCDIYSSFDSDDCQDCVIEFLITSNNKKCVHKSKHPGCSIMNDTGTGCKVCKSIYTLKNGKCSLSIIPHCEVLKSEEDVSECVECYSSHELNDGECHEQHINYCSLSDENGCFECKDTGILILMHNGLKECYKSIENSNISKAKYDATDNTLEAVECKNDYYLFDNSPLMPKNQCLIITEINYCLEYKVVSSLNDKLECISCKTGFILVEGTCQIEPDTSFCKQYDADRINCLEFTNSFICENGYCYVHKTGIRHCTVYYNEFACKECDTEYFLLQNVCIYIEKDLQVDNCVVHDTPEVCSRCEFGYYLKNKECVKETAKNCLTSISPYSCHTCANNHYLSTDNGFTNCIPIDIENCKENIQYENRCKVCEYFYALNKENKCVKITKHIPFCKVYSLTDLECLSEECYDFQCEECDNRFVLSIDQKKCIDVDIPNQFDNCSSLRYLSKPTCTSCISGYYFNNDSCLSCSYQTYEQGCEYCDYENQERCLVCRSGYWMDIDGNCIFNSNLILIRHQRHKKDKWHESSIILPILTLFNLHLLG